MEYNKGGDELRIKTKWGDLVAQVGYDESYPEIYISLEMEDRVEFTLALVGQVGDAIRTLVKGHLPCEDFDTSTWFYDEEIRMAWQEVFDNDGYEC